MVFLLIITSLFACDLGVIENTTSANAKNLERSQLNKNTLPKSISKAVLRDSARVSGVKVPNLQITQVTATNFSNPWYFQIWGSLHEGI